MWDIPVPLKGADGEEEGWLRPLRKCRGASLAGADGVVGSSHRLSEVERTTPAAPSKEWDHLLDGAATPPLPRRGLRLSRRLSQTPVSSGRLVGNAQACKEGWPSDSENIAKHPLIARPGWFSDESKRKTTPAASASVASPNFL